MIKVDGQWKVTSLDDETVKIMSANFKSVEDEISQTLSASSEEADAALLQKMPRRLLLQTAPLIFQMNVFPFTIPEM